ncbi:hypothetical protein AgCh_017684 [Apium graveolens]
MEPPPTWWWCSAVAAGRERGGEETTGKIQVAGNCRRWQRSAEEGGGDGSQGLRGKRQGYRAWYRNDQNPGYRFWSPVDQTVDGIVTPTFRSLSPLTTLPSLTLPVSKPVISTAVTPSHGDDPALAELVRHFHPTFPVTSSVILGMPISDRYQFESLLPGTTPSTVGMGTSSAMTVDPVTVSQGSHILLAAISPALVSTMVTPTPTREALIRMIADRSVPPPADNDHVRRSVVYKIMSQTAATVVTGMQTDVDSLSSTSSGAVSRDEVSRIFRDGRTDQTGRLLNQHRQNQPPVAGAPPARQAQNVATFKSFKSLNPPEFHGTSEPIAARVWLREVEKTFEIVGVENDKKTLFAAYMLKGEASYWWEAKRNLEGTDVIP